MKLQLLNIFLTGLTKEIVPRIVLFKCSKCGIEKNERTEFYWLKEGRRNGKMCKECKCIQKRGYNASERGQLARKEYQSSEQFKETRNSKEHKTYQKEWRNSETGKDWVKEWNESEIGKESSRKKDKKYKKSEHGKEKSKERKQSESGKIANIKDSSRRRSLMYAEPNTLTKEEWKQIQKDQKHCCAGCGAPFSEEKPATEDHIEPLGEGPGRTKDNIQALCQSCNSIKGPRSMEFLLERLRLNKEKE